MAIILSIETSTSVCSVALHNNGKLIATEELKTPQSAATQLAVQIDNVLKSAGVKPPTISAVAVSSGPGSYTGLRIGIAAAKGFCFGVNIPLISINSLFVLAAAAIESTSTELLCPMIDARRMEVYCCLLDKSFSIREKTHAKIIDATSFADVLALNTVSFFGDGAGKCKGVLTNPNAIFLDNLYPSAAFMGALAFQKFESGQFENLALFEPIYLKEFVAKTKLT